MLPMIEALMYKNASLYCLPNNSCKASTLNVENVVNAPKKPTVTPTDRTSWASAIPNPNEPIQLINKMERGTGDCFVQRISHMPSLYRHHAPNAPPSATYIMTPHLHFLHPSFLRHIRPHNNKATHQRKKQTHICSLIRYVRAITRPFPY